MLHLNGFSFLTWLCLWLFKSAGLKNFLWQTEHSRFFFSSSVCFKTIWVFRFVCVDICFSQMIHLKKELFAESFIWIADMCGIRFLASLNVLVHCGHCNNFSELCTIFVCVFRSTWYANDLGQTGHVRDLSPLCFNIWRLLTDHLNDFEQTWHFFRFSWCILEWDDR